MKNVKIAPSILSADFSKMGEEVLSLEKNGADIVHCDVMDGVFVNNITFGIKMVEDIRKCTSLPLDCHLMIVHPEKYVERFAKAGADIITVHYESCDDPLSVVRYIHSGGVRAALSIKPATPPELLFPMMNELDMVLVMTVEPGFGGQKLIPETVQKVKVLRDYAEAQGLKLDIEVDGGIGADNLYMLTEAGANVIVAGSAIFKAEDPDAVMRAMRKSADEHPYK